MRNSRVEPERQSLHYDLSRPAFQLPLATMGYAVRPFFNRASGKTMAQRAKSTSRQTPPLNFAALFQPFNGFKYRVDFFVTNEAFPSLNFIAHHPQRGMAYEYLASARYQSINSDAVSSARTSAFRRCGSTPREARLIVL
jgi:hypothetical protein